jgi:LysR family transcriptional regulator for bpeEF and oprC
MDQFTGILPFVNVAETRSFTTAAYRLGISPSAVSKAVTKLEGELGVRLLTRSSRSVALTQDGFEFFERCRQIVTEMEEARQMMAQARAMPRGVLRVTSSPGFGMLEVMPLIPNFLKKHPTVHVEMDMSVEIIDLVEEGFDVAIRIGEIPDSRLIVRELTPHRRVIAASPAYLAEHATIRRPEDLTGHNCLTLLNATTGMPIDWQFAKAGGEKKLRFKGNFLSTSAAALTDAAVAGVGVIQTLDFNIRHELANGRLVQILEEFSLAGPKPFIVYPENRRSTPKVRVFVDYVLEHLGPHP